jgi:hypothetical protein
VVKFRNEKRAAFGRPVVRNQFSTVG